jgi:hypothetical protein
VISSNSVFWTLYWITRLDSIHDVLVGTVILIFCLSAIFPLIIWVESTDIYGESLHQYKKIQGARLKLWFKIMIPIVAILEVLNVFVPSKQDAILMLGGVASVELIHKAADSEIGQKTEILLNNYLDQAIAKTRPVVKEKVQ